MELDSANSLNELESRFFPRASKRELSLASMMISALRKPEQRTQSQCAGNKRVLFLTTNLW